jgi:hypothetical protein
MDNGIFDVVAPGFVQPRMPGAFDVPGGEPAAEQVDLPAELKGEELIYSVDAVRGLK